MNTKSIFLGASFSHCVLTSVGDSLVDLCGVIGVHASRCMRTTHRLFIPRAGYTRICCRFHRRFGGDRSPFHQTMLFLCLGHCNCGNLYHCGLHNRFGIPFNHCGGPCFPRTRLCRFTRGTRGTFFCYRSCTSDVTHTSSTSIICYSPPCTPLSTATGFATCRAGDFALRRRTRLTRVTRNLIRHRVPILVSGRSAVLAHR